MDPLLSCDDDGDCDRSAACVAGVCQEGVAAITSFDVDRDLITSGVRGGVRIQGDATLSWTTQGADEIEIRAGDEVLDLRDCIPVDDDCAAAGALVVTPTETTTYTISARGAQKRVAVATVEPAAVVLSSQDTLIAGGDDVSVDYLMTNAATFTIGIVVIEDGERRLLPCAIDGDGNDAAPCALPAVDGVASPSGTIEFVDVTSPFTLAAIAKNGADDDLGAVRDGEAELTIEVEGAPAVRSFTVDDDTVQPGATATISWEVANAVTADLVVTPANAVASGLESCGAVDLVTSTGGCTIELAAALAPGQVVLTLVAEALDGQASAAATRVVRVGVPPSADLDASPRELPAAGGSSLIAWRAPTATRAQLLLADGTALVDTAAGVGDDVCLRASQGQAPGGASGSTDGCNPEHDELLLDVASNTLLTLVVENAYGESAASIEVHIEGTPAITALTLGGDEILDDKIAKADSDSETLVWIAEDAARTTLERATRPAAGCASPAATFVAINSFGGETEGSFEVAPIDGRFCLRVVALGDEGQRSQVTFEVARDPLIDDFVASDDSVGPGTTIELALLTRYAEAIAVSVDPVEAVPAGDLEACRNLAADGSARCAVTIAPEFEVGDVTFSAVALGANGAVSQAAEVIVSVGVAPVVESFTVSPEQLQAAGSVNLAWQARDGDAIEIVDDAGGVVFASDDAIVVRAGETAVESVTRTTTFTIAITNGFGTATAQATAFLGPSFATAAADGDNLLDGRADVLTGQVVIAWVARDATEVSVQLAPVPANRNCATAPDYNALATGAADDVHEIGPVVRDQCLRLIATNAAQQSSTLFALLVDKPEVVGVATSPGTLTRSAGGTVVIDMQVRGATTLDLVVDYLDADGDLISSELVCDESDLNSGALSGSAGTDSVSCTDTYDNAGCLLLCRFPPANASTMRYRVNAADQEADGAAATTEGGEDVAVQ